MVWPAMAQSPDESATERTLTAVRASGAITVDGRLDEAAWNVTPIARGFVQSEPREGDPATFDTEVRVVYDDEAMYFGVVDDRVEEQGDARLLCSGLEHL